MKVKDIQNRTDLVFVSDSQDVNEIRLYIDPAKEVSITFDAYFVKEQDGEYVEIWGMYGIVPTFDKELERVI